VSKFEANLSPVHIQSATARPARSAWEKITKFFENIIEKRKNNKRSEEERREEKRKAKKRERK
jgi:cell shape-determining protein MreC